MHLVHRISSPIIICAIVVAIVFSLLIDTEPASAHGIGGAEPANSTATIDSISPKSRDFSIKTVENGENLELKRTSKKDVVVLGVDNEPYILINENGTYLNKKSATRLINDSANNDSKDQETKKAFAQTSADPKTKPEWEKKSSNQIYVWHDHRAHYMGSIPNGIYNLGKSKMEINVEGKAHTIVFSFQTTTKVNTLPYLIIALLAGLLVISAFFLPKLSNVLYNKKTLIVSSLLLVIFESIHIFGYVSFSNDSVVSSLTASLYGLVLIVVSATLFIKLATSWLHKDSEDTVRTLRAPLLCVVGFIGLAAGSLIEYKSFSYRYLTTTIDPTLSRILILLVGILSFNLLLCGLRFMRPPDNLKLEKAL